MCLCLKILVRHKSNIITPVVGYDYLKQTQHCKVLDYFYVHHFGTILTAVCLNEEKHITTDQKDQFI